MANFIPVGYAEKQYVPCSWSTGTDAEIVEALQKHYAGEVDLTQYWAVGDERDITLNDIVDNGQTKATSQSRDYVIVAVNTGVDAVSNPLYNYQLVTPINSITRPTFIIQQKQLLAQGNNTTNVYGRRIDPNSYNWYGWGSCEMRTWLNDTFYNTVFPNGLISIVKQVNVKTGKNGTEPVTTQDYFFLVTEYELKGSVTWDTSIEPNYLSIWPYYETSENRIKSTSKTGANNPYYWTRSPDWSNQYSGKAIYVTGSGSTSVMYVYNGSGVAPAFCI